MNHDTLMMATLVFVLLAISAAYAAVVLQGWQKWVGVVLTFTASFALATWWQSSLSPALYLFVGFLGPLLLFYTWSIVASFAKARSEKSSARQ